MSDLPQGDCITRHPERGKICGGGDTLFLPLTQLMRPAQTHAAPTIMQEFETLTDPRREHRRAYPLQEMLLVALCAISSDADDWAHVAEWGEE